MRDSTTVTGDDIVFVNGLGAVVEANHNEQNIRYLGQSMWIFSSTTWLSKHAVSVAGGQATFWILQTVTSAVRIDVPLNDGLL